MAAAWSSPRRRSCSSSCRRSCSPLPPHAEIRQECPAGPRVAWRSTRGAPGRSSLGWWRRLPATSSSDSGWSGRSIEVTTRPRKARPRHRRHPERPAAGLVQVRELRGRDVERRARGARRPDPVGRDRPADRHLVLHVPCPELSHGHLPGHCPAPRSPIDFALYITFFPQLIAGPIVRFHEIRDQLVGRRETIEHSPRRLPLRARARQKGADRRHRRADRERGVRDAAGELSTARRCSASSPTRSSCTSTSAATRTWRSGSQDVRDPPAGELRPTVRLASSPSSGGVGTCRCRAGSATTCTFRSAATGAARQTYRNLISSSS